MYRFTMPSPGLSLADQASAIRLQLNSFTESGALKELGFFNINEPLSDSHSRIIVLGGSLNVCRQQVFI